ncbi:MAG TPA: hydroxyisourate hydrolase [Sphingobium sp.]|uniref:hydroxyisourate hydrolase n=1 Tax=Sphingobium sp. TaxID=1912891 RepID=UPI000EC65832|nr:hydroxyisourate hydrolase [Sphingobium sp.]HAF42710.1 hydroxyisourate hydrolase [Sphingobium sp.]
MSLSTHILDTMHGQPAAGVTVSLWLGDDLLFEGRTDADGRCPALRDLALVAGRYRLSFAIGDYFRGRGVVLADPPFLDVVPIDFGLAGSGHYHVPVLASPFSYSTYRGS